MTYTNSIIEFNQACTDIEAAACVDSYFTILDNPTQYPQFVAWAEELDSWDCYLQQIEEAE